VTLIVTKPILSAFLRSQDTRPIAWCVIGICVGIYLFVQGFRLLQRRQLILNTPVSKIRSASMGMVELSGLAVGPYTLVAPVTERHCYYYRTLVWEWKRRGRSSQWVKIASECMHVPFFLDDNTAKVMVDPRGAELDLHRDFQQEFCDGFFTTKEEAPPNVHALLSRHGISTNNKIKVEEFCIKPKNALFLLGTLDENHGLELTSQPIHDDESISRLGNIFGSPLSFSMSTSTLSLGTERRSLTDDLSTVSSVRDSAFDQSALANVAPPTPIRLSSDPEATKSADMTQQQKVATALLKAGISNPAAWAAAGIPSAATNSDPHAPLADFDPHPPVVMRKGKNNPTFLISWRSQRELANSLGWKCTLMIWGGPALALVSLYGLLALTHSL
jgi:E3 Ubiquitin ligase